MAKHPQDWSKNGDVGHAWIYLGGVINGHRVYIEGGHSGELGVYQTRYAEGVINYIECGYANPHIEYKGKCRHEPDPIKYLWSSLEDGFFQIGSGGHQPTYAAKIGLTEQQFQRIYNFIRRYDYSEYSLTGRQCTTFVKTVAALAELELDCEVTMSVEPWISLGGQRCRLWQDPRYSVITFSSPDVLERALHRAVEEGRAQEAVNWYRNSHSICIWRELAEFGGNLRRFPARLQRFLWLQGG